ncbi:MAG: hypothetical protein U5K32_08415 [Bacteroidales bacterium]|nr:hypothetical protein [Bacteroidales bacterium]
MSRVKPRLRSALIAGLINTLVILLGLTGLAGTLVSGWFGLSSQRPGAWLLLLLVAYWAGARATNRPRAETWREALSAGLVAGLSHGLLVGAIIWLLSGLVSRGMDVRTYLAQISPEAMRLLTFGLAPSAAAVVSSALILVGGLSGALLSYAYRLYGLGEQWQRHYHRLVERVRQSSLIRSSRETPRVRQWLYAAAALILLVAPLVLDRYWNYTLGTVGIYIILGLGLNVVVGMAGILNLGYAAFFAIGAYSVAILTAPQFGSTMSFWVALPIGVLLATLTGVLLSFPVLRMRGDYLAIVTLGFGEIIRILAKSDVLTDFTGGPRGIRSVGGPSFFGVRLNAVEHFVYFILLGIGAAVFITLRLQQSRVGRALKAMREDEDVAQAVGVYTLKYKVMAFAIAAAFAGVGGVLFASRNKFTGPEDFTLLVSVNVLCIVIIGRHEQCAGCDCGSPGTQGAARDLAAVG